MRSVFFQAVASSRFLVLYLVISREFVESELLLMIDADKFNNS